MAPKKQTTTPKPSKTKTQKREYDLDWIFNPLARDEKVLESGHSSDEHIPTGKNVEGYLKTYREHDPGNHQKVFLMKANKQAVFKLSKSAMAVYLWIMYSLEHKTDIIHILPAKCCSEIDIRENTFTKAIRELIASRIIARVGNKPKGAHYNDFFINPLFMFRGKRFDYYRSFLDKHGLYKDNQLAKEEK